MTRSGLFWALFVTLGVMGLIAAIVGLAVGPPRAATACLTLGVVSIVVLASYAYRHRRENAAAAPEPIETASPSGARLTNAQYRLVEGLWASILIAALVATIVADGGARTAFGVPAVMAIAALAILEARRRRDAQ